MVSKIPKFDERFAAHLFVEFMLGNDLSEEDRLKVIEQWNAEHRKKGRRNISK